MKFKQLLRHRREYTIEKKILLTDTLFLKIKNESIKKVWGFKYLVRPHFTMYSSGWGCDFYELIVNGTIMSGQNVNFMKRDFDFIERRNFKKYYYSINTK